MWLSASNVKLFLANRALSFTPKSITAIVTENIRKYSHNLRGISPRLGCSFPAFRIFSDLPVRVKGVKMAERNSRSLFVLEWKLPAFWILPALWILPAFWIFFDTYIILTEIRAEHIFMIFY